MPQLCRDCLDWRETPAGARCPACGGPRLLRHGELGALAIAHVDCDAFYAAVEKRDDPALADRPVIVGGGRRGVVTTCCYIARIRGVRSAMPMARALRLCPEAAVIRPRMAVYAEVSREIRARMEELTPLVEPLSLDEAFLDLRGTERLRGEAPARSLARLAARIAREVGVTVSVGLSHNKFLAKTASDLDKPRGFAVIGRAETAGFLAPRPVGTLWGVGPRLAERLEADGLRRVADLRALGAERLVARYGGIGARLAALARGEDDRPVRPDRPAQSISAETTFETDIAAREPLTGHLWRLSVKVSDRAKAQGLAGGTVTLKLRTAGFRTLTRQAPLSPPDNLADRIYRTGESLLAQALDRGPFRLIGIGLGALGHAGAAPAREPDLFGPGTGAAPDPAAADAPAARAERVSDEIRARFGTDAIFRGRALR